MKNEKYNLYIKLKKHLEGSCYREVPLDKLSGYYIADMVYHFSDKSLFGKLKMIIKFLFFIPKLSKYSTDKTALFGWSIKRADYEALSNAYKKRLGWDFDDICLSSAKKGWKLHFDFMAIGFAVRSSLKLREVGFLDKLYVCISIYSSVTFFKYLEKSFKIEGIESYLSFNSSFDYESVFTLFLRKNNIETYTMQHGMYFEYRNQIPFDVINYENIMAKYILLWGEFSKKQIEDFIPKSTIAIVLGNPLYENFKKNNYDSKSKTLLVGLPRKIYQKEIEGLINLLKDKVLNDYEFKLRLHPSLDVERIIALVGDCKNISITENKTLADDLIKQSYYLGFVGFNSTVLFEATLYSLPVLQYISRNDEFITVGFQEFKTANVLLVKIKHLTENSNKVNGFQKYFE